MNTIINHIKAFLFFFIGTIHILAQDDIPSPPFPPKLYVNLSKQFPNYLTDQQAAQLEKDLENFVKETSNEIVVVIIDDFNGYEKQILLLKWAKNGK